MAKRSFKLRVFLITLAVVSVAAYWVFQEREELKAKGLELVFQQQLGPDAKVQIGRAQVNSNSFSVKDLQIEIPALSFTAKSLAAEYSFKNKTLGKIEATGAELKLKASQSKAGAFKLPAPEIVLTDSTISFPLGQSEFKLSSSEIKSVGTSFPINLSLKNSNFENLDGSLVLSGLALSGTITEARIKAKLSLKEALLGSFYHDFEQIPIAINFAYKQNSLDGDLNLAKPVSLVLLEQKLDLPQSWRISWSGKSQQTHFSTSQVVSKKIYGGEISAAGISCIVKAGELPRCATDLEISALDLGLLTENSEFGRIFGVVDGKITRLTMLGTMPQYFDARLESRDKGKRAVSVKAINNLSEISAGTGAIESGLFQFFDYYGYKKIAFSCGLKDNVFTLVGLARAGSEKYLIDGGFWPPKLDLLIQNPYISFSEMLNRIGRVGRQNPEVR